MTWEIRRGDSLLQLRQLASESVHCVVTSPPYWGLRDYGAVGQLGLESTPAEYLTGMLDVFREVKRVLRQDGTCWVNMGDCYATGAGAVGNCPGGGERGARWTGDVDRLRDGKRGYRGGHPAETSGKASPRIAAMGPMTQPNRMPIAGLKPKDLVGMPWRLAFALQADGWYLRSDIIWHKPNPMPESVTDRPTKSHEYIFLLTKSERYFYDAKAIAEPCIAGDNGSSFTSAQDVATKLNLGIGPRTKSRPKAWDKDMGSNRTLIAGSPRKIKIPGGWDRGAGAHGTIHRSGRTSAEYQEAEVSDSRNKRTVWTIATQAFPEAHFATFPEELITPCILAGSKPGDVILDPFAGSGTTGVVALRFHCSFIGIELNQEYAEMAERRITNDQPLFNTPPAEVLA